MFVAIKHFHLKLLNKVFIFRKALRSPIIIRLGCKCFSVSNALAYFEVALMTTKKGFMALVPGGHIGVGLVVCLWEMKGKKVFFN